MTSDNALCRRTILGSMMFASLLAGCGGKGKSTPTTTTTTTTITTTTTTSTTTTTLPTTYNDISYSNWKAWSLYGSYTLISDTNVLNVEYTPTPQSVIWVSDAISFQNAVKCPNGCSLKIVVQGENGFKTLGASNDCYVPIEGISYCGSGFESTINLSDGAVHTWTIQLPAGSTFNGVVLVQGYQGFTLGDNFFNPAGSGIIVSSVDLLQYTSNGTAAVAKDPSPNVVPSNPSVAANNPSTDSASFPLATGPSVIGPSAPDTYKSVYTAASERNLNFKDFGGPVTDRHNVTVLPSPDPQASQ